MDRAPVDRSDAAHPGRARAAEEAHDQGLELVVAMMAGGRRGEMPGAVEDLREEGPPPLASYGLAVAGFHAQIDAPQMQGHVPARAEGFAEGGVGLRVGSAQAVVQMGRLHGTAAGLAPGHRGPQQGRGVGAAGQGDQHARTGGVHLRQEPVELRDHQVEKGVVIGHGSVWATDGAGQKKW